jgi:hypothetical protein
MKQSCSYRLLLPEFEKPNGWMSNLKVEDYLSELAPFLKGANASSQNVPTKADISEIVAVRDINKFKVTQVDKADPMAGTIILGGYSHLSKLVGRENLTKWAVSEKTQRKP